MADNVGYTPGTGANIAADDIGGVLYQRMKLTLGADNTNGGDVSTSNPMPVEPQNITTTFRESFETYNTSTVWNQSVASGDIVQLDGNAVSASYLVISKDPLTADTETYVQTQSTFPVPLEAIVGLGMSQRVLGQELSLEYVSTETPIPLPSDITISSITQATSTLTVTTSTAHGLVAGMRIGIRGITSDSRLNYPCLVVNNITSSTVFTATAGPMGTIPSLSVGPYTSQGFVYFRSAMGGAPDGYSQIFENATVGNASMYVRSDSGDVYPSGTAAGNHSVTVGNTTSIQAVAANYSYAFVPTTEYRSLLQVDRVQYYDVGIDATVQPNSRRNVTQVIPKITENYKIRFRFTNDKALTVPTAKIVSASKSGSTTATITTATAHGLTTGDYVYTTGIRNGTDFPPITTAAVVASTPTSTTFTVVMGSTTPTTTSYGGLVARGNGGNLPAGFAGAGSAASLQTATVTSTQLTLTSSGTIAVVVGDYVNVYGCRDNSTGADLSVDGVYKVVSVVTTTAILEPIGSTVLPAPFGSTACGGALIKRTDARISYIRLFEYLREKVEVLNKNDNFSGVPVVINTNSSLGTVSTVSNASLVPNLLVTDISSATQTTTNTSAAVSPSAGNLSQSFAVVVTAVAGTNPTLDVVVQESDDTGTNWFDTYHFPRITAVGQYRSPLIPLVGNRIRYVRTLGGTGSPSFGNVVYRLQSQTSNPLQRQFFDRTVVPNTLNSTSPSFFTEGCVDLVVLVNMGAITTTAPTFALQVSVDNVNWVQLGADITTTASTTSILQVSNAQARFSRLLVKSAGSGATLGYVMVKGVGN
jgi:hypothetical protein